MKIYIQEHTHNAGKWIYRGYGSAWERAGYDVVFINSLSLVDTRQPYLLMVTCGMVTNSNLDVVQKSDTCFLYVAPNYFPKPWGDHPNWRCPNSVDLIEKLNSMKNVIKWTFGNGDRQFFTVWRDVYSIPLAFDDINYTILNEFNYKYDVCFIGGCADNGMNEKVSIMRACLSEFLNRKLKCAFHVGENISHEMENQIMASSRIALNIHDAYQRIVGADVNERTFKSLGITGLMVSDEVNHLKWLFPDVYTNNDPKRLCDHVESIIGRGDDYICKEQQANIDSIKCFHTYTARVERMIILWKLI